MKKVDEVLPFFKNGFSPESESEFAKLRTSNGEIVQQFISRCTDGLSPAEFESFEKTKDFEQVLAALHKQEPDIGLPMQVFALKSFANTNRLLKKLDGKIPWESYLEQYPCLKLPRMTNEECFNNKHCWSCKSILRRPYYHLIERILTRYEILAEDGGIFADRLLTAIELGVPFSRISNFTGINMDAAIRVLQKHFPYVTREFLAQCADEYLVSWCQETPPSENSAPHAESQKDEAQTKSGRKLSADRVTRAGVGQSRCSCRVISDATQGLPPSQRTTELES